jgi:hypothetical protein
MSESCRIALKPDGAILLLILLFSTSNPFRHPFDFNALHPSDKGRINYPTAFLHVREPPVEHLLWYLFAFEEQLWECHSLWQWPELYRQVFLMTLARKVFGQATERWILQQGLCLRRFQSRPGRWQHSAGTVVIPNPCGVPGFPVETISPLPPTTRVPTRHSAISPVVHSTTLVPPHALCRRWSWRFLPGPFRRALAGPAQIPANREGIREAK